MKAIVAAVLGGLWPLAAGAQAISSPSFTPPKAGYPADFQISVAGKGAFLLREDSKLFYCYFVSGGQSRPSRCTRGFQLPRETSALKPITYRLTSDDKIAGTLSVVSSFGSYYQCEGTPAEVLCTPPVEIPW
jgi:hypothetical protein